MDFEPTNGYTQPITNTPGLAPPLFQFTPQQQHVVVDINVNVKDTNGALDIIEEHEAFILAMDKELVANHYGDSWDGVPLEELLRRAEERLQELKAAIELRMTPGTVLTEAADCANFLMMVADNYAKEMNE